MLVHESSHQYFNLLGAVCDFADPAYRELHYSPFTRSLRPLDRLLTAYHAFANVLILREQWAAVCSKGKSRNSVSRLKADLRLVEDVLVSSNALTPIGRALFEPLYGRLHGAS
jgi:HEXXH motif-containing protein